MFVNIGTNHSLTPCFGESEGYLSADAARGLKDSSQRGFVMAWVQMLAPVTSATPSNIFGIVFETED